MSPYDPATFSNKRTTAENAHRFCFWMLAALESDLERGLLSSKFAGSLEEAAQELVSLSDAGEEIFTALSDRDWNHFFERFTSMEVGSSYAENIALGVRHGFEDSEESVRPWLLRRPAAEVEADAPVKQRLLNALMPCILAGLRQAAGVKEQAQSYAAARAACDLGLQALLAIARFSEDEDKNFDVICDDILSLECRTAVRSGGVFAQCTLKTAYAAITQVASEVIQESMAFV